MSDAPAQPESPPKPGSSRAELYEYQTWVHVGPGADNCTDVHEDTGTVECNDPLHFHAWCRLPNPFQYQDIREKALAAKARRMRLLREDGTDLNVILNEEIDALARRGDACREEVADELLRMDWWKYLLDATRELAAEENPTDEAKSDEDEKSLVWEHIEDDRIKLIELREQSEEDRSEDELRLLESRVAAYDEALEKKRDELVQPKRDELLALDVSDLLDRLRDQRIAQQGSNAFQDCYAEQEWLTCSYYSVNGPAQFASVKELHEAPSAVVVALQAAFQDLEREKGGVGQGNS